MSNTKINIENLTKIYYQHSSTWGKVAENLNLSFDKNKVKELCVLRNFNLKISEGERLGIIGRNGAGKSTLLRIVAGLMKPTSGSVKIKGELTALFDVSTGFHPDFTGRQNVLANLGYRGIIGSTAEKMLEEIIEFSELYDFIDQPFKTYSAGMQSRLTFSVATMIEPDILIVDEVLGAGDAYFANKCLDRMKEITQQGATVIFVSHSLSAVLQFCNRAIWLERGNILADGRPIDVIEKYQKSVDTYERLRMTAKNAKLNIKLSPSILSGSLGRYVLFRVKSTTEKSKDTNLFINKITLLHNNVEEHKLMVGGALDYDVGYGLFITNENKDSSWGKPVEVQDKQCRRVSITENLDNACFMSLFPLETDENDSFTMELTYLNEEKEDIIIEVMNHKTGQFDEISRKKTEGRQWETIKLEIPQKYYSTKVDYIDSDSNNEVENSNNSSIDTGIENVNIRNSIDMSGSVDFSEIKEKFMDDDGPVYITGFSMYRNGKKETHFQTGDRFVSEIEYINTEEIEDPKFVVNITRIDGVRMRQSITSLEGLAINKLQLGKGKISFIMDPLLFGPGEYMVSVGVFKEIDLTNNMTMSRPMSLRSNSYEFKVSQPKDVFVDMGCVQCPVEWEKK